MAIWSIKIVPSETQIADEPAAFRPDFPGANPGDPLQAASGDVISWNNTTDDEHQPWPTDADGNLLKSEPDGPIGPRLTANYLSDPIHANDSSRPGWSATQIISGQNTVFYCCKNHPKERGQIVITS